MKPAPLFHLLVDDREKTVLPFPNGVTTEIVHLAEGDFTTPALRGIAAIERKSLVDFIQSITKYRDRFDDEIERLQTYRWKCIVIEGNLGDFYADKVRTQMTPESLIGSMASFHSRHNCPAIPLHSPWMVGRYIAGMLRRWEDILHAERIEKAE